MNRIFKYYKSFLVTFPFVSQSVQTGVLMGSGDLIAQALVEKKSLGKLDLVRTGKFAVIGTIFVGPSLRLWYGKMDQFFGRIGKITAVKKVAADQLLFAPVFLLAVMVLINFANGFSTFEVKEHIQHNYPDILKNNYLLWPAVQLCNFYVVPLEYQVFCVQVVALFWNTYLAWKMNKNPSELKEPL